MRNSGATAVVEGVGDHGCEYMTGGVVVVLGPVGRNFAAGMSGGLAFVLRPRRRASPRAQPDLVGLEPVGRDDAASADLLERHRVLTGSAVAARLLAAWPRRARAFVKVMPNDLRRVLGRGARRAGAPEAAGD